MWKLYLNSHISLKQKRLTYQNTNQKMKKKNKSRNINWQLTNHNPHRKKLKYEIYRV